MRDFKGMKRQRGRNRKPGGGGGNNAANPNRSWDSQGPENIKVRGNAQTVYERYMQLARDAASAGDRVLAENHHQHAEHYFRVLRALQPARPVSEIAQREMSNQGFDIDFEDESGAQAAAFLAAQQAADRAAEEERRREQQRLERQDQPRQDGQRFDGPRQEWRPEGGEGEPRAEGEGGGRRETRRERWERRRDERNRRFAEGREGEDPSAEAPPAEAREEFQDRSEPATASTEDERAPRRGRRGEREPRHDAEAFQAGASDGAALPGFLTRGAPAPSAEAAEDADVAPAPRKRAPRRKPAEVVEE